MNTDTLEPHYNEGQLKIFAVSQRQPIVLVTAGPGFGKTTTIEGSYFKKKFTRKKG